MASIRLSGVEISDLTLELSDSHDSPLLMSTSFHKLVPFSSAKAVQAAEDGIQQLRFKRGLVCHISLLQPIVAGAAKKTSRAVGQATKIITNIAPRGHVMLQMPAYHFCFDLNFVQYSSVSKFYALDPLAMNCPFSSVRKKEKGLKQMQTLYNHNRVAWCELFYKSLLIYEIPVVFF
ncbi:hypothetical protein SADUNF_Sadunf13G0043900 [Salix dunnii]|uniref:Uncharacterized protein n=1 Tax=Salix dunnii TaxID=1413687 RepID=A0A835JFF1_9ROSI|nr:hypothetical protein SADUNF_Sadunf13G0043900 [Salix dunnii]